MFRISYLRHTSLIAGVAIHPSRNSIAVSFLSLPQVSPIVASYYGDFAALRNGKSNISLPVDMPAGMKKGYCLVALLDQLPELADTRQLAFFSRGYIPGEMAFDRFIERKGIEMEDVTDLLEGGCIEKADAMILLAQEAARAYGRKNKEEKWLKARGYK